ncbi:MAG: cysteine--tRNA ligase [Acidobacteriota bacterium]
MLTLFNTLSRQKEEFRPLRAGEVRIYTCGPTVYDFAHIGNFRAYLWEDLLRRTLKFLGLRVHQVMNLTDVDDKTIHNALERGVSLDEYTAPYIQAFFEDLEALGMERAEEYPRATRHIPEMLELIRRLEDNGHTYRAQGSVYFRISTFAPYGRLSGVRPSEDSSLGQIDTDEYAKEDARDFVLWKSRKPGEPYWDSPFGAGRPGWHLECSAMSMKYLGEQFDLHTGAVDNIFPHHENELAQSEAATGRPFVNYWLHCAHLIVDGEKMSKSKGNFYTLRDLLARGYAPRAIRHLLLSAHYRKQLNFTLAGLEQSAAALTRLDDFVLRVQKQTLPAGEDAGLARAVAVAREAFRTAIEDDLNAPTAMAVVFDLVREIHTAIDSGRAAKENRAQIVDFLRDAQRVLGIFKLEEREEESIQVEGRRLVIQYALEGLDEEARRLVRERLAARQQGDFARADSLRNELAARGVLVEDAPGGCRVKRA